jgi:hypothetical protein
MGVIPYRRLTMWLVLSDTNGAPREWAGVQKMLGSALGMHALRGP